MPYGYSKRTDTQHKCEWCKVHKNNEETKVNIEKIPNQDRWFAHVWDEGDTVELGRFTSKAEAETAVKNWMQKHPKGMKGKGNVGLGGNSVLPGLSGAQDSNDFWG